MTPPNAPPFIAPAGVTWLGNPLPDVDWYYFCTHEAAQVIMNGELAALKAAGCTILNYQNYQIQDIIAQFPQFSQTTPAHKPPWKTDVSIWKISIVVSGSVPAASPTIPAYKGKFVGTDLAGSMVLRQFRPSSADVSGPPDPIWAGTTVGKNVIAVRLFGPTPPLPGPGYLTGIWVPPGNP